MYCAGQKLPVFSVRVAIRASLPHLFCFLMVAAALHLVITCEDQPRLVSPRAASVLWPLCDLFDIFFNPRTPELLVLAFSLLDYCLFICLFVELYFIRPSLWLCLSLVVADCLPTVSTHPVHHSTWHKITMYHSASHCITVHCRISQCITLQHTTSQCIAENHIVLQLVTMCSNVCPQCQPTHSQQPTTVQHSKSHHE